MPRADMRDRGWLNEIPNDVARVTTHHAHVRELLKNHPLEETVDLKGHGPEKGMLGIASFF